MRNCACVSESHVNVDDFFFLIIIRSCGVREDGSDSHLREQNEANAISPTAAARKPQPPANCRCIEVREADLNGVLTTRSAAWLVMPVIPEDPGFTETIYFRKHTEIYNRHHPPK